MATTATRTVGLYEAKTKLSQLVDEVIAGETITITRHGVPVATLSPVRHGLLTREEAEQALANLREKRKGVTLGGLSIREMIDEGRA
jgi:prevent-host-death family protein